MWWSVVGKELCVWLFICRSDVEGVLEGDDMGRMGKPCLPASVWGIFEDLFTIGGLRCDVCEWLGVWAHGSFSAILSP